MDRISPQSIESEMACLGAMILDNYCITEIMSLLPDPIMMYRGSHRIICGCIYGLEGENKSVDLITLTEALKETNNLEAVGGAYYLTELAEIVPSSANVKYYAEIVRNKYYLREAIVKSTNIQTLAYNGESLEKIYDKAGEIALSGVNTTYDFPLDQIFHMMDDRANQRIGGSPDGILTGIYGLDQATWGFQKTDYIIIAGRPSQGKTAFAIQVMRHAVIDQNITTAMFSLEMDKVQIAERMVSQEGKINLHHFKSGFSKEELENYSKVMCKFSTEKWPLYIYDQNIDINSIKTKSRILKKKHNLGLIIVDYIQLMDGPGESRNDSLSKISRQFKLLAKELDIPIIILSQLSKAADGLRPRLMHLRECGALEQDSDVVIFPFRKDPINTPIDAMLLLAKQRNGPLIDVSCDFEKEYALFS